MNLPTLPFKTDDGEEIFLIHDPENRTFWASQKHMAQMFDVSAPTINEHIQTIQTEMGDEATTREYRMLQVEGGRKVTRSVLHYNHETILAVGFRCHSLKAKRYQKWATDVLFREIMREKRDLEKEAYKNLIRTMSFAVDYNTNSKETAKNFAVMQDMMHYAAAGLSAAGIIINRADHRKDYMGLTSFAGKQPVKREVTIAKNYLYEAELDHQLKIATGFMNSIDIAATGYKKWEYKQTDLIQELKDYLVKYHQRVWEQSYSPYSRNAANKHAHREYELFREVLRESLNQIATGQLTLEDGMDDSEE